MNNGRVLQLFRRLSTGDTRFNTINNNKNLHLCRTVDLDRTLLQKRSDSSPQLLPPSNCFKPTIRTMATSSDVPGTASGEEKQQHKFTNRLKYEKSPYLLQHAHNPVDWYPWSTEAFEKAKNENKLIFLSVGYSTCHWCHVMEHESFENEDVAKIMNANFVNIKVDREERPDIDKIYMTFIQATQGGGGWPMSVFLTPDLNPVTGGTYFPPEDKYGRPGFKTILNSLTEKWHEDPNHFMVAGAQVLDILKRSVNPRAAVDPKDPPGEESWKKCILQFTRNFDEDFGGFGATAPKFPQPCNFNFLFHAYARDKYSEEGLQCLNMCLHTLKKMALGGIHDHIGGGFSRYSVDHKWHVPHFEKMLYDQGQLTVAYCDAYLATKDEFYANVVRDILRYVDRDLKHHRGGFYCAEDADSLPNHTTRKKVEGAFYVWEYDELHEYLGDKVVADKDHLSYADVFCHHFNVKKDGNVEASQDPHGELLKKNVLIIYESDELTASHFEIPLEQFQSIIKECCEILFEIRNKRPRPHLDSKFLTSWNGLMISGFSKAGQVLNDNNYIDTAVNAANFIRKYMYDERNNELLRSCYRDESTADVAQIPSPIDGFLDDYAYLIRGLLDLYEASLSKEYLEWAQTLQQTQNRLFWDEKNKGYFSTPLGDDSVILRLKEDQDGAEPSGNSISAHNLLRLSAHSCNDSKDQYRSLATDLLISFTTQLTRIPIAVPDMTSSLMFWHDTPTQVFIAGRKDDPETKALLQVVRTRLIPGRVIAISDTSNGNGSGSGSPTSPSTSSSILSRIRPIGGHPAAYVCRHYACSLPVTETTKLAELLDEK